MGTFFPVKGGGAIAGLYHPTPVYTKVFLKKVF